MLAIASLKRLSPKHLALAVGLAALAGCASAPDSVGGPIASPSSPASGPAAAAVTPSVNFAATSQWTSEERLMPLDPILALVGASGSINDQLGLSMTCNPDNGKITARLGRQPAARVGQNVIYRLRLGAEATPVEGRIGVAVIEAGAERSAVRSTRSRTTAVGRWSSGPA